MIVEAQAKVPGSRQPEREDFSLRLPGEGATIPADCIKAGDPAGPVPHLFSLAAAAPDDLRRDPLARQIAGANSPCRSFRSTTS